jgi:hypothetical protein
MLEHNQKGQLGLRAVHGSDARKLQTEEQDDNVRGGSIHGLWQWLMQCRNYVFSIILGTVALSYGSVPFYKMVQASIAQCSLF